MRRPTCHLFLAIVVAFVVALATACENGGKVATSSPVPTATSVPVSPGLKPADFQGMAASPCFEARAGDFATIVVHPSMTDPRCLLVHPSDKILFANDTDYTLPIKLGRFDMQIEPHKLGLLDAPVGTYLATGGHRVEFPFPPGRATILLVGDSIP